LKRGQDPLAAVTRAELAQLRRPSLAPRRDWIRAVQRQRAELTALASAVAAMLAVGAGRPLLGAVPALASLAGLAGIAATQRRVRRLVEGIRHAVPADGAFEGAVQHLASATSIRWAGLMSWRERDLEGSLEREWSGLGRGPSEAALKSWLLRDGDSAGQLLVEAGSELGSDGEHVAVPLADGDSLVGYLVVGLGTRAPRSLLGALARFPEEAVARLLEDVLPPPAVAELPLPALRAAG
jgi:hypothetical protein